MPDNFLIRWKCADCGTTYVVFSTFSICCDDVLERVILCNLCRTEHPAATTAAACCAGKPRPQPVAAEPPPRRRPSLGKSAPMTEPRPPREKPTHRRHFGGFKMPVNVKPDPPPIPIAPPVDVVDEFVKASGIPEDALDAVAVQAVRDHVNESIGCNPPPELKPPFAHVPAPPPPKPRPLEPVHNIKPITMTIEDEPAAPDPPPFIPRQGTPVRPPDPNCQICAVARQCGRVVYCQCMV